MGGHGGPYWSIPEATLSTTLKILDRNQPHDSISVKVREGTALAGYGNIVLTLNLQKVKEEQEKLLDYFKKVIEHAPRESGPTSPSLLGWNTLWGLSICVYCAARIFNRGGHLPNDSEPAWVGDGTFKSCCLCQTEEQS